MFEALILYLVVGCVFAAATLFLTFRDDLRDWHDLPVTIIVLLLMMPVIAIFWPLLLFTFLRSKHVEKKKRERWYQTVDWNDLKARWHEVDEQSKALDSLLYSKISDDAFDDEKATQIRTCLEKLSRAHKRWESLTNTKVFQSQYIHEEQNLIYHEFLDEGQGWPRVGKSIYIDQDPAADANTVSKSTIASIFQADVARGARGRFSTGPLFRVAPRQTPTEKSPWQLSITGAFRSSIKKLRGQEKEKLEHALEEILIAPATAIGNTKTPLSNNLKDFWRYRLGDWRIIYTVDLASKTVTLLDYTHRSKAYH